MKIIPPEITDRVVDFLHSDYDDLRSCSLVCSQWLSSSHYHLFHKIDLQGRTSKHQRRNTIFAEILVEDPRICYYVRDLQLRIADDEIITFICKRLLNVVNLSFNHCSFECPQSLSNILSSFPSLIGLRFENAGAFSPTMTKQMDTTSFPKSIKTLCMGHNVPSSHLMDWMVELDLISQVEALECSGFDCTIPSLSRFVKQYGHNLINFSIDFVPAKLKDDKDFSDVLTHLPNLQILDIKWLAVTTMFSTENDMTMHIDYIPHILRSISSESISSLSLRLEMWSNSFGDCSADGVVERALRDIACILGERPFSTLREFVLKIGGKLKSKQDCFFTCLSPLIERAVLDLVRID